MSELRRDPISDYWVIVAKKRAQRPLELEVAPQLRPREVCPFCPGNEACTPPEVLAIREAGTRPNTPGWRVRIVPNKFPALESDSEQPCWSPRATAGVDQRFYQSVPGIGVHDLIVESPAHLTSTGEMTHEGLCDVLLAYRDRLRELKQDRRLAYAQIFKNVRAAAGASIEHTHSQLIALPIVPVAIERELSGSLAHFTARSGCLFCDLVRRELSLGERIVLDTPGVVAFCPFASRFPYETWVMPKRHRSHFESLERAEIADVAAALRRVIGQLEAALDGPAYNYLIHTAPFDTGNLEHYHWHIEIIPRLTSFAGFEWGSGYYINPAPPEETAAFLRSTEVDFITPQNVPIKETR